MFTLLFGSLFVLAVAAGVAGLMAPALAGMTFLAAIVAYGAALAGPLSLATSRCAKVAKWN